MLCYSVDETETPEGRATASFACGSLVRVSSSICSFNVNTFFSK